ncbi:DUF6799 domain-containing protein [Hymenobacter arizonensis]|uniref:DUF6799 domain-containing protein n=1 Tax=Hymenobacter arizonensis TaxID=1227077 RepID=A0A1I5SU13_HYMAR|nr:DUF6799 domain-containing protein [Hymenobacter arizonensis]SFP74252.1 hypothetical protein SAMN04515668_0194 [Hymenobacter arizonensis]
MLKYLLLVIWTASLLVLRSPPAQAQKHGSNDGFQRRDGQMYVVRNGQLRPMTRDVHLPTGATVTKDGFVVSPDGTRTELREGQGCDLRGRPVAVRLVPDGSLVLGPPAEPKSNADDAPPVRSLMQQMVGNSEGSFKAKKAKKNRGKGKGPGKGKGRWKDDD